jgi:hypothetical protein
LVNTTAVVVAKLCRLSRDVGDQVQRAVSLALASRPPPDFWGYWQRHKAG